MLEESSTIITLNSHDNESTDTYNIQWQTINKIMLCITIIKNLVFIDSYNSDIEIYNLHCSYEQRSEGQRSGILWGTWTQTSRRWLGGGRSRPTSQTAPLSVPGLWSRPPGASVRGTPTRHEIIHQIWNKYGINAVNCEGYAYKRWNGRLKTWQTGSFERGTCTPTNNKMGGDINWQTWE